MVKGKKAFLSAGEWVILIISIVATMFAGIFAVCRAGMGPLGSALSAAGICKDIKVEVKESYENIQEIPFKSDSALYTFLKTKICENGKCISVDSCIKYIDCVNGCEKVPVCQEGYELCEENGNYFCRRYEIYEQCEKPQNPCKEGEEVYKEKKACTKSSCRKCSNERETYICKEDITPCGSCKEKYMLYYNSWIVWCQKKPEFVPKEEEVQNCKKAYGEQYEVEKCEALIQKTLKNIWDKRIKLSVVSKDGTTATYIANKKNADTIYPVHVIERKLFIPHPARTITLIFEVW